MKQNILLIFTMASLIACKDKGMENLGPVAPQPTGDFELTTALEGNGLALSWSKPEDLAGELSYTVYLGDQKLGETAENSFSADIAGNGFINGRVTVTDASGNTETRVFLADGPGRDYVYIPDPEFEQSLIDQGIDKEGTVNGKLRKEDVKGVEKVSYGTGYYETFITSLIGIEAFVDIQVFHGIHSYLTELDLSQNVNLKELTCRGNRLTELDLSQNVNLVDVDCSYNKLTELNLSKNVGLTKLHCEGNQFAALNLSNNENLVELHCERNELATLDLSKNLNLKSLYCGENKLTTLDLNKNVNLVAVDCRYNKLTTLDLSKNVNLRDLTCTFNQLTTLDLSQNVNLGSLSCFSNELSSLDLSKNVKLGSLACTHNQLTELDLSKNVNLGVMYCTSNPNLKSICVADVEKAIAKEWEKDYTAQYVECE